jgi:hypothetical protein
MPEDRPPTPAPTPTWRDGFHKAAAPKGPSGLPLRHYKSALVGLALLAVAGAVVGWFWHLDTTEEPFFLSLTLTEYDDRRLPVNAFAEQDGDLLLAHFSAGNRKKEFGSQQKHLLLDKLNALRGRGGQPVVVHLCAHARTEGGEVYVLPGEAQPGDAGQWVRLGEVLHALGQCPSRNKLLLLDVMHPLAAPPLGILVDDVAERVASALEKVDDRHLQVLCACSAGQVSLVSEDIRQSVFAYYLDLGLRGWADGYPGHRTDGRVSVHELAAFVRDRTDRWASRNAGARQTPFLTGKGEDFPLVACERRRAQPPEMPPEPGPYPKWLLADWKLRDEAAARHGPGPVPEEVRQLEAALLRAEQRWRGGADAEPVQRDLEKDVRRVQDLARRAKAGPPRPEGERSLGEAHRLLGSPRNPALEEAVASLLKGLGAVPAKPSDERVKKDRAALKQAFTEKTKGIPSTDVAWALFEALADELNPRPDKIEFIHDELLPGLEPPLGRFAETRYLRRLLDLNEALTTRKKDVQWPLAAVRHALQAARHAAVLSPPDPRTAPWVQDLLTLAEGQRAEGERGLFAAASDAETAQAAAALRKANRTYELAGRASANLLSAHRTLGEARAFLRGYAPYLTSAAAVPQREADGWAEAVRLARGLGDLLQPPSGKEPVTDSVLERLGENVRGRSDPLREFLSRQGQPFEAGALEKKIRASEPPGAGPAAAQEIDRLLHTPLPRAAQRAALWAAGRRLARHLHEETLQQDQRDDQQGKPAAGLADWGGQLPQARRLEYQRARLRARVAIELARLGGAPQEALTEPEGELSRAAGGEDPAAWSALARTLFRMEEAKRQKPH